MMAPKFQEAVSFTRKLGIRFSWIDSLCIAQDDRDEWAREAASQGGVHLQKFITDHLELGVRRLPWEGSSLDRRRRAPRRAAGC